MAAALPMETLMNGNAAIAAHAATDRARSAYPVAFLTVDHIPFEMLRMAFRSCFKTQCMDRFATSA